mgnify:CR=1 FL=1
MRKIIVAIALLFGFSANLATAQGITEPMLATPEKSMPTQEIIVGNDRDEHGCIGSAGYTWDAQKKECVQPWNNKPAVITGAIETTIKPTSAPVLGGDTDTHGCIGSAGYSWDAVLNTCARPWEAETTFGWAEKMKITTRLTVDTFEAERNITREEAAAFIARSFEMNIFPARITTLMEWQPVDKSQIAPEFTSSVNFVKNANIIKANSDDMFGPKSDLTTKDAIDMLVASKTTEKMTDAEVLVFAKNAGLSFDETKLDEVVSRRVFVMWLRQIAEYTPTTSVQPK